MTILAAGVCAVALALTSAGCTDGSPPRPAPIAPDWQEIALPPAPAGNRNLLRAAAVCDGHWYLVGGYRDDDKGSADANGDDDATRPAAWSSVDGHTWTPMNIDASSYYGVRGVLYTAACRNGRLIALGAKPGGAHGNPRVVGYAPVRGADGTDTLTEVSAAFELYGGPRANNVGWVRPGPLGFIITGNRSAGAAVWLSPDGVDFEILEGTPGLASTADAVTWDADAVAHGGGWIVVGGTLLAGHIERDAAAWRSADGRTWQRMPVPSSPEYDEMSLVTPTDDELVAVGHTGDHFQAWRLTAGGWRVAGPFGSAALVQPTPGAPLSAAYPADLATVGNAVFTAVVSAGRHELWSSSDRGESWRPVTGPMPMPAGSGRDVLLAGVPGSAGSTYRLLLAIDDGTASRLFLADRSG